jgi:hypothetical protein
MSIWATTLTIADDDHIDGCTRLVRDPEFEALWHLDPDRPCTCQAGPVRYQGSHVTPSDTDERVGCFDLAEIPGYVHGAEDDPPRPWLRIALSGRPRRGVRHHEEALLDRTQVARVHAELGRWLAATEDGDRC